MGAWILVAELPTVGGRILMGARFLIAELPIVGGF